MLRSALLQSPRHGRGILSPSSCSPWLTVSFSSTITTLSDQRKAWTRNSHWLVPRRCLRQSEILIRAQGGRRAYQTQPQIPPVRVKEEKEEEDKRFKVLFMGRDEFSCLVLKQLYEAKDVWKEIVIATQPDVHVGRRGSVLSISPLKTLGEKLDIPVWTIPKVKKDFKTWELPPPFALTPAPSSPTTTTTPSPTPPPPPPPTLPPPTEHLLITASFGRILPSRMLASFQPSRRLNVHPSLVPAYRGPAPIQWTVVNGERESGVSVLEMLKYREGIDAGGVWGVERVSVPRDATFESVRDELAVRGGKLLVNVLRDLMNNTAVCRPQAPVGDAPKASMITAQDAFVDFKTMSAADVWRRFRGIGHQKPLYTYAPDGKALQLVQLTAILTPSAPSPIHIHPPFEEISTTTLPHSPGSTILDKRSQTLLVRCGLDGSVLGVGVVKPEGKGVRRAGEWWTGLREVKQGKSSGSVVLNLGEGGGVTSTSKL